VLLRETSTRLELRIALPQTGAFADLTPGARGYFSFDPQRAMCFPAGAAHA
jgi:spermidine/putrescine transport system ATP-binding protein